MFSIKDPSKHTFFPATSGKTMKVAVIGRTELLYNTALRLHNEGHEIVCILTAKEAPESTRSAADFQELATIWKIPFLQSNRISVLADFLQNRRADIAVSINYTGVLPQSVIDLYPLGILNAHGGDLPRYRGNACQAWAIINGEERIGLCIHKMIGGLLDAGDIIAREYLSIDHKTKVTDVWEWMSMRTPELMLKAVQMLETNAEYVLEKQSESTTKALRCYPRKPEDGRIHWSKPAIDVLRLINASNRPYPGAFCYLDGEKVTIWDAELVLDGESFCAIPGQVTRICKDYVEVACAEGKLRLLHLETNAGSCLPVDLITSVRQRLN